MSAQPIPISHWRRAWLYVLVAAVLLFLIVPMLIVVPKAGHSPDPADLLAFFDGKVAKWWIPDEVAIVGQLPRQATGKVSKADLRRQFIETAGQKNG